MYDIMFDVVWLVYLVNLFDLTNPEISDIELICHSQIDLSYTSTSDRLIAYVRLPHNETSDKVIYHQTASLNLNFDLSPMQIFAENRHPMEQFIMKDDDFKLFYDSSKLQILIYRSNRPETRCSNRMSHDCLAKKYDHCWFGDLRSTDDSLNSSRSTDCICIKSNRLIHHDLTSNKSRVLPKVFKNKLNGLAFVKIRHFGNQQDWIIFGNQFTNAYLYDHKLLTTTTKRPNGLYQPSKLFFGCPQSFCLKATFDDIVYDASLSQLIIYRGLYYYQINM